MMIKKIFYIFKIHIQLPVETRYEYKYLAYMSIQVGKLNYLFKIGFKVLDFIHM